MPAELWELQAREAIRDTIATYTVAGDRLRLDDLAGCFTADGVLEIRGRPPITGRAAIVEFIGRVPAGSRADPPPDGAYVRHHVSSVRIESVTHDEARATSYFLVLTSIGPDHWGRYRDVLVPDEGRWRFRHRYVAVDGHAPGSRFAGAGAAEP